MVRKGYLATLLALLLLTGMPCSANSDNESVFESVQAPIQEIIETVIDENSPRYRERLEQQVSRGEIRRLRAEITGYDLSVESCGKTPEDPAYGITASGEYAREGIIAVDPIVIPMHSVVYIEGMGTFVAKDTGGAIKGNRIDIFFDEYKEAIKFGRQHRNIYVIQEGK